MPGRTPRPLTDSYLLDLPLAREKPSYVVRDKAVRGFFCEVNRRSKSLRLQHELWTGERGARRLAKTVKVTICRVGEMPVEQARVRACELLATIRSGVDPNAPPESEAVSAGTLTVGEMFARYAEDLRFRDCAERTASDVEKRLDRYLSDWKSLPVVEIKRSMADQRHKHVTRKNGKRCANQAFEDYSAAFRLALKKVDDPDLLGPDPTGAITWNRERRAGRYIAPEELSGWYAKLQKCPSPLRREGHLLGLLSGLRPGKLWSIRREWLRLDKKAILFPAMKSGRSEFGVAFALPLSREMIAGIRRALAVGDVLFPDSPWLFPSRSNKTGEVIATAVWKEKELINGTGHALRHTHRTFAHTIGVDDNDAELLLDHKLSGVKGTYLHTTPQFKRLLLAQQKMSTELMKACTAEPARRAKAKVTKKR